MKNQFLTFVFISIVSISFSQNPNINKVWAFGYDCCTNPLFYGTNLDFSSGVVHIDTVQRHMNFRTTNAQFFDANKNLIFCSNGVYVANVQDDTMLNGSGLNPCPYTTSHSSGFVMIQGLLVIPFPGDSTKYYLFHESIDDYGNTNTPLYLYYSVIDMTLDGGLGAVVQKNTIVLHDTLLTGGLTACKHANGRDWWVVTHQYMTGYIYKILVTANGIRVDSQDLHVIRGPGQHEFSQAGDKFAMYEPEADLDVYDFDRCTGMFSNRIHANIDDSASVPGLAFSPNGRYLYLSSSGVGSGYLYQFDIMSANLEASKQIIAVRDSIADFYLSQIGPDNKIYIVGGQRSFHVINYPDSAGAACGFCQRCILLPTYNGFTIPNHPNYFLGAEHGSICDSLTSDVPNISLAIQSFNFFPDPARNNLYITQGYHELIKSISIFNSIGQKQTINYSSIKNCEYMEVNVSSLSSGIYFLEMMTEKQKLVRKFVKE